MSVASLSKRRWPECMIHIQDVDALEPNIQCQQNHPDRGLILYSINNANLNSNPRQ